MNKNMNNKINIDFVDKIPPNSVDYEEQLISILIQFNNTISYISYFLKPHHFYKETNKIIYELILKQHAKGFPFGTIELNTVSHDMGINDKIGGVTNLVRIAQLVLNSSSTNIQYYAITILEKYILRSYIGLYNKGIKDSYDNLDPLDIAEYIQKEMTKLLSETEILKMKELRKSLETTIDSIINIHQVKEENNIKLFYTTGLQMIDDIALIRPNNCMILAGKSGSGKTRFTISLIRNLLLKHKDISIKWYSFEDNISKLIKCILSPIIGLTDKQLSGINYTLSEEEIKSLKEYQKAFMDFDIEIVETSRSMSQIAIEYKSFVNERKDRMNILIIDNLMLLNQNSYVGGRLEVDDAITKELANLRMYCDTNDIKSYIIAIHHFNDEAIKKENIKSAFRPTENHIKGSSRFRDAVTQVALLNCINNFPELIEEFPLEKAVLEDLYILDIVKNRDGDKALIRFFGNPEYSEFIYANGDLYGGTSKKNNKRRRNVKKKTN